MSLRFLKFFHSLLEIGLSYFLPLTASWESVRQIRFGELAFLVSFGDRLRLNFIAKLYTFGQKFGQISSKLSTNLARRSRIPKKTFLGKSARGKSPIPILPGPAPQIWGAQYKFGILLVRAPENRPSH